MGCNSSPNSPGEAMDRPHPPTQSTPAVVTAQLRIATGDHPPHLSLRPTFLMTAAPVQRVHIQATAAVYLLVNRLSACILSFQMIPLPASTLRLTCL